MQRTGASSFSQDDMNSVGIGQRLQRVSVRSQVLTQIVNFLKLQYSISGAKENLCHIFIFSIINM
jgi:hypothetical protein